jgi:hypothetical protein
MKKSLRESALSYLKEEKLFTDKEIVFTKLQFSTSACLLAILCCVLCLSSCNKLEEGDVV